MLSLIIHREYSFILFWGIVSNLLKVMWQSRLWYNMEALYIISFQMSACV